MKTYYFNDDSWYDNPSCDCCEGMWMDCFNIDHEKHPDFIQNGSALSVEDCWEDVLIHEGVLGEGWVESDVDLKGLMEKNGLTVTLRTSND